MAPTADLPVPSHQGFYSSTHPSETFLPSQTRHIHDSQGAKDSLKTKPGFTHKNLETKRKTTNSKIQRYSRDFFGSVRMLSGRFRKQPVCTTGRLSTQLEYKPCNPANSFVQLWFQFTAVYFWEY